MVRFHIVFSMFVLFSLQVWGELPHRPFQWEDDENYKPLIYRNSEGEAKGIFYDLLTEAFGRMDIPLKNRLSPWIRAQNKVKKGEADGMVTVYTKARQKLFEATDPIVTVEERVFTNRNNPKLREILDIRSVADLKNFTLVDTADAGWSKENLKGMKIIWVPTAESAINMLGARRVDIYLMNNFTGPYFIRDQVKKRGPLSEQIKNIVMGRYPITTMEYQLLIRKDSPYVGIIDQFNEVLHQMHDDGTYEKIIKRYTIEMRYNTEKGLNFYEKE